MNSNWNFSSDNDPYLGPEPGTFGIAQILLATFLVAIGLSTYASVNDLALLVVGHLIAIACMAAILTALSPGHRIKTAFFFVNGSILFSSSLIFLKTLCLTDPDNLGMGAIIPWIGAMVSTGVLYAGVRLQFVSLKWLGSST